MAAFGPGGRRQFFATGRTPGLDAPASIPESPSTVSNARFIIQISKGLIRDQRARRLVMFYSVLAALVLIFAGSTFCWSLLRAHPLVFLIYWAGCAWITLLAVLLAFYDMVKVRAEVRRERWRLERELIEKAEEEKPHDPHPR